jgi:hypothetical protein
MNLPGARGERESIVRGFRRFRQNLFPAGEIVDRSNNSPGSFALLSVPQSLNRRGNR